MFSYDGFLRQLPTTASYDKKKQRYNFPTKTSFLASYESSYDSLKKGRTPPREVAHNTHNIQVEDVPKGIHEETQYGCTLAKIGLLMQS